MTKRTGSKSSNGHAKSGNKNEGAKSTSQSRGTSSLAKKDVAHVVSGHGGWAVRSSRTGKFITGFYSEKSDAIDAGQRIARSSGSKVLVHGRSGQIFQRSPVRSTISESVIRKAVRAAGNKAATKSASKKSTAVNSSRKSLSKKK